MGYDGYWYGYKGQLLGEILFKGQSYESMCQGNILYGLGMVCYKVEYGLPILPHKFKLGIWSYCGQVIRVLGLEIQDLQLVGVSGYIRG